MVIILVLILLAVLAAFGYHMYVEPIDFISKLLGEKDDDNETSKDDKTSKDDSGTKHQGGHQGTNCADTTPGLDNPCPDGCEPSNISCVDCRAMKDADCKDHAECRWIEDKNTPTGPLPGHCIGVAGDKTKLEHCIKYTPFDGPDDEAGCNADPYCFYATEKDDLTKVKAGSAFDNLYNGVSVEDSQDYVSSDFFSSGGYGHARFDPHREGDDSWLQQTISMQRRCLPLKCELLDAKACLRAAVKDDYASDATEKRYCTVQKNSSPPPTCVDAA